MMKPRVSLWIAFGPVIALIIAGIVFVGTARADDATGDGSPCATLEVFHQDGCPHCARALAYVESLRERHPDVDIRTLELSTSRDVLERFIALNQRHQISRPGVPSFHMCDVLLVGFDSAETTGARIEAHLGLTRDATAPKPNNAAATRLDDDGAINAGRFGTISLDALGLPAFTVVIGLIDGFNPCAMWVLLFLLSLLVNLRSRARMFAIAGTFVAVSGLVYFAFMAAWLNVFLVVGFSRPLQVVLGIAALGIATVHAKDFFVPHIGPSLSIPDAAKPGIYQRFRRVVNGEKLLGSLVGVTALAVLVNLVELLCTAGLPALYTQILTMQQLSSGEYYGYLALYNLAYVFDDGIMVGIAVFTLTRRKMQEGHGRWLKLVSAVVIGALGALLLLAPGWLR